MNSTIEGVGKTGPLPAGCRCVEGVAPEFDYHGDIHMEGAQQGHFVDRVIPLNGMGSEPYEFVFEPMADYFIDLNSVQMYAKLQVVKPDGTALEGCSTLTNVKLVDNFLSSMWKTVETKVNNVTIHPESAGSHAYRAQLEYLLSVENRGSYTTTGFGADPGFWQSIQHGKFDLCGPVALDILRVNKHLAPGNKLSLTFHRAADSFPIIVTPKTGEPVPPAYKLKVYELVLYANRIRVLPDVLRKSLGPSLDTPQHYLTSHTEVKDYPVASGLSSWNGKLHSGGILPHQVVVAFVDTDAITGNYAKDPLEFKHNNLNHICLRVNGVRLPQDPLEPKVEEGLYARTLSHVFQNTGKYRVNGGNFITEESFKKNHFIIPFDLTPDQCNNFHRHASRPGTLDLELGWSTALAKPLTVIVLSVFNQVIQLRGEANAPAFSLY